MRLRTMSLPMALLAVSIGSVSGQQAASAAKTADVSDLVGLYEGPRGSSRSLRSAAAARRGSSSPTRRATSSHGYAVLVFDKRGTGASSGSWRDVGLEPLADDVAAAVKLLAARSEVDATERARPLPDRGRPAHSGCPGAVLALG